MQVRTNLKAGAAGLGDVVAEFTHATGLDQLAKKYENLTGNSCGCDERQAKLNQLFPFSQQAAGL
ncbi:MAG: hypothetical protein ACK2UW_06695 [Anaerolineales bacterium]|jgi:hypothetical protein